MPLHPQDGEKNFSGLIYRKKCVSAPPQDTKYTPSQNKSQFLGVFAGWLRFGGIFRRRRLKKRSSTFLPKKCTPADKILATPMHDPLALGFVTAFMQSAAKTKDTRQIYVQQNFIDFHEI